MPSAPLLHEDREMSRPPAAPTRTAARGGRALVALVALASLAACGEVGTSPRPLPEPAPPAVPFVTALVGPEGLAFDRQGNLYVGSTTGRILRIAASGTQTIFAEVGAQLAGLAVAPGEGLVAALFTEGDVVWISQAGERRTIATGLDSPNGIAIDPAGRILVSASGFAGAPRIVTTDIAGNQRTLTDQVLSPNGLAFGPDGRLYVAETLQNRIVRMDYDPATGTVGPREVFANGALLADGLAFDVQGNLLFAGAGKLWLIPGDAPAAPRPYVEAGDVAGPASLAYGSGRGRRRDQLFFTNYGFPALGSGTTVASVLLGVPGLPLLAP